MGKMHTQRCEDPLSDVRLFVLQGLPTWVTPES